MQILLTASYEFGFHKGLDLIEGEVIKFSNKKNKEIKIPHMGWNELYPSNDKKEWKNKILKNSLIGKNFYFVHSFVCLTKRSEATIAFCNYSGISIPAVVSVNNVFGCQFHPEKSSDNGLTVLKNFCEI
jgi:glutamine amidotransferase